MKTVIGASIIRTMLVIAAALFCGLTETRADLKNITGGNLTDGYTTETFDYQAVACGGVAPYAWSIVSGDLSDGLSMDGSGHFTGTPEEVGYYIFTLRVTDSEEAYSDREITLYIYNSRLQNASGLGPQALNPPGCVGEEFDFQATAVGGATPETWPGASDYSWSVVDGSLPDGLSMDSSGHITGTPSEAGEFVFTLRVTDYASHTSNVTMRLWIQSAKSGVQVIVGNNLTDAYTTEGFDYQATAIRGVAPYTWSISAGSLPDGLSMDGSGHFTGTSTNVGYCVFTLRVTDDQANYDELEITHYTYDSRLQNTSGQGPQRMNPVACVGEEFDFQASATGGAGSDAWSIVDGSLPDGLSMDSSGNITGTPTEAGEFVFTLRVTDYASHTSDVTLRIWVSE